MEKKLMYGFGGYRNQNALDFLDGKGKDLEICFVLLETEEHGGNRQEFAGREIVKRLLREGESRRIVMLSVIPLNYLRKLSYVGEDLDFLLSHEEVGFFDIAEFTFHPEESLAKLRSMKDFSHIGSVKSDVAVALSKKEVARCLGEIRHVIQWMEDPQNPKDDEERRRVALALSKAREYFPSLLSSDDESVLEFIRTKEADIPLVREGEDLAGVFCDIDGTLLVNGKPNTEVLEMLKGYEAKGKAIILWTLGNISETKAVLFENGISYPLQNKLDFAGAVVEIAIDDEDRNSFFLKTRVHARQFIRVG